MLTHCPPGGAINVSTIILKKAGLDTAHAIAIAGLISKFETLEAIDLSENGALGTSGAARLVGALGRGVKSVSLKGTGLGLAAGQGVQNLQQKCFACSDEDWTRLEGALGGLGGLEAIDLSENGALGTSGVGRLVSSCAGELIACVICFVLSAFAPVRDVCLQGACDACGLEAARGLCPRV